VIVHDRSPGPAVAVVGDQVRLIDATPLPCGASRETVKRSELAGWAGYGYCAAHPAGTGA
jgi:hypothetical protein